MNPTKESTSDAVQVCVRIRPFSGTSNSDGMMSMKSCVRLPDLMNPDQLIIGKDRAFTFDHIYDMQSEQKHVYASCVSGLVHQFIQGYNATVLAYGQTGSGKTYTMGSSDSNILADAELNGIIPRVVGEIFSTLDRTRATFDSKLTLEYVEIYNEEIRDLLHPETPSKQMRIRENEKGQVIVQGVQALGVTSSEDVYRYLAMGNACRTTGKTLMNAHSSRSHALLTLRLNRRHHETGEGFVAKFHLVDLAGSERAKRTGAEGLAFQESVKINEGLLALGNVISALSEGKNGKSGRKSRRQQHIPYRQSKLTRLLKDSLGGNSQTLMIACISPSTEDFEESLNTLKYAHRAKKIQNQAIVNVCEEEEEKDIQEEEEAAAGNQSESEPECPKVMAQRYLDQSRAKIVRLIEANDRTFAPSIRHQLQSVIQDLSKTWLVLQEEPQYPLKENDTRVQALEAELQDARLALAKDEEIFHQKNLEIEQLRAQKIERKWGFKQEDSQRCFQPSVGDLIETQDLDDEWACDDDDDDNVMMQSMNHFPLVICSKPKLGDLASRNILIWKRNVQDLEQNIALKAEVLRQYAGQARSDAKIECVEEAIERLEDEKQALERMIHEAQKSSGHPEEVRKDSAPETTRSSSLSSGLLSPALVHQFEAQLNRLIQTQRTQERSQEQSQVVQQIQHDIHHLRSSMELHQIRQSHPQTLEALKSSLDTKMQLMAFHETFTQPQQQRASNNVFDLDVIERTFEDSILSTGSLKSWIVYGVQQTLVSRVRVQDLTQELEVVHQTLETRCRELEDLRHGVQVAQLEFDRRLTKQILESNRELALVLQHQHQKQDLVHDDSLPSMIRSRPQTTSGLRNQEMKPEASSASSEKSLKIMLKHVMYYQEKMNQYQAQLASKSSSEREHQLEAQNERLLKDLIKYKSKIMTPVVRVPRQHVTEIPMPKTE